MKARRSWGFIESRRFLQRCFALVLVAGTVIVATPTVFAAISWDGQGGTNLWFDPVNWSFANVGAAPPYYMPTSNGNSFQARDAVVNASPSGEGVVYDPLGVDAVNYAAAAGANFDYPTEEDPRFDRDTFWRMYISAGGATQNNKVTMKSGSMEFIDKATSLSATGTADGGSLNSTVIIGRGGASPGIEGWFVQEGGYFNANEVTLDIGNFQTSPGNGFYEYKGGILEVSLENDSGLRLGASGSSGPAGNGTFIVHNSTDDGRIRVWNFNVASGLGGAGANSRSFGKLEYHADANGTRPIQVLNNLSINSQDDSLGISGNKRTSIFELVLDAAPQVDGEGVPMDLGLIDVDSDEDDAGIINGNHGTAIDPFVGEDNVFYTDTFDNGGTPLIEGSTISAVFGNVRYDWILSYNGIIEWVDKDTSEVLSISAVLDNPDDIAKDVVLIGLGSEVVGPAGLPGDYNGDHVVNGLDYAVWRNNLNDPTEADINSNGDGNDVSESDFLWWKERYGDSGPPGGGGVAQVPEPTSLVFFVTLLVFGLCRRR